jgi:hypothetical protein
MFNAIAWWRRSMASETRRRSAPRVRRSWLRNLDLALSKELRDAGTLSCPELFEMTEKPLHARASMATIVEWWEYAYRRGWLEEHGAGRCRLTQVAVQDLRAARRRELGPDYLTGARVLLGWIAPAGLIATIATMTRSGLSFYGYVLAAVLAVAVCLAAAAIILRLTEPWLGRVNARSSTDLLEGRRVRFLWLVAPAIEGEPQRVYSPDELCAPGHAMPAGEEAHPEDSTASFALG